MVCVCRRMNHIPHAAQSNDEDHFSSHGKSVDITSSAPWLHSVSPFIMAGYNPHFPRYCGFSLQSYSISNILQHGWHTPFFFFDIPPIGFAVGYHTIVYRAVPISYHPAVPEAMHGFRLEKPLQDDISLHAAGASRPVAVALVLWCRYAFPFTDCTYWTIFVPYSNVEEPFSGCTKDNPYTGVGIIWVLVAPLAPTSIHHYSDGWYTIITTTMEAVICYRHFSLQLPATPYSPCLQKLCRKLLQLTTQ